MAEWQYKSNQNVHVPIDYGYHVHIPHTRPDEKSATGYIEDPDGQRMYLWLHQIESGFQVGGGYAQSANKADWHPRNFIQPRFKVTGQTANQHDYAKLAEFIRVCQNKSLRFERADKVSNTTKLVIYSAKGHKYTRADITSIKHAHSSYVLYGHVLNVERRTTRFVNAPEFSFEFSLAYAYHGLFRQDRTAHSTLQKLSPWMDIYRGMSATYQSDPDVYYLKDRPEHAEMNGEQRPT